ncbi:glycosyltransferase family 2 protein [Kineococcus rhizosphaerae]|nr:glycosyltransferase family 2 protein [Kineococcus rhizosphaerae]
MPVRTTSSAGDRSPGRVSTAVALGCLAVTAYTHVGYPVLVRLAARYRGQAAADDGTDAVLPTLTVVVPAHDEEEFIGRKIEDTLAQGYPAHLLEVLVVDDGSQDGTADVVRAAVAAGAPVRLVQQAVRGGKSSALNRGVREAGGEVVVFTDANGSLVPGSLRAIVAPFLDPRVAVVSGAKKPVGAGAHGEGESTYQRLESGLKTAESAFGAVVGADGGIFAVRRSTYKPIPPGVYADDYWIPLAALEQGHRVAHVSRACAVEAVSLTKRDDFERRTRISAGIWQGTVAKARLADPRRGWVALAFVSHRVLRTAVVPPLLVVAFGASARAARRSVPMRVLWGAQVLGWSAAGVGAVTNSRSLALPYQFALVNVAAVRGGLRQLLGRQSGLWKQTSRGAWSAPGAVDQPQASTEHVVIDLTAAEQASARTGLAQEETVDAPVR